MDCIASGMIANGIMQPPSAARARPTNTPSDPAWSGLLDMAPTSSATAAATSPNRTMIAPAARGSPHDTLKTTAVTTTMYAAWRSATR